VTTMAALFYWSGTEWLPIATGGGGGGGIGPPGPPGADGISITVSGPQPAPPLNPRKGDQWIADAAYRTAENVTVEVPPPVEPITVTLLPDPPQTVTVSYLP
jgi:hypothetical protein